MSEPRTIAVDDDVPSDRASATIGGTTGGREPPEPRSTEPVRAPHDVLQRWLAAVITHPSSVREGRAAAEPIVAGLGAQRLEDLVTPSRRLSAVDRLGVYHHAYKARLVECVTDDFRVCARAMPELRRAAAAYVDAHPSRSWNLVPYAQHFPAFLDRADAAWLAPLGLGVARDLARLEWAMVEVSHAPSPRPLDLARLGALDPERWPELTFAPSAALRVLALDHPILPLYAAITAGEPFEAPAPAWSSVATWRQSGRVWRMSLTPVTHRLLSALMSGTSLGEALSSVPPDGGDDVMRWFSEWVRCGFFDEIVFPASRDGSSLDQ